MIFVLKNVIFQYVEHDIVHSGGTKIHDSYYLIEYFDFVISGQKEFSTPDFPPNPYVNLFSLLETYAKTKKTLEEQSTYLFMKEAYDTSTIILHTFDISKKKSDVLFKAEFPKKEWANIEDLLLVAGLAVFKRAEKHTIKYELHVFDAQYELVIEGDCNTLSIEAPDEDKLIESLTVIGHSVDEGEIVK